jgi:hypothetical protein
MPSNARKDTTIRAAVPSDAAAMAAIYNHYITETVVTFEEEPVEASEMAARIAASSSLPMRSRTRSFLRWASITGNWPAFPSRHDRRGKRLRNCLPSQQEDHFAIQPEGARG